MKYVVVVKRTTVERTEIAVDADHHHTAVRRALSRARVRGEQEWFYSSRDYTVQNVREDR